MPPLVSVITTVYNGELYLEEAINSLLAQSYCPLEIIVVNDGSQDKTEEIIEKYGDRIRSVSQANRGQSAAMNVGLLMARGRYLSFLDSDDLHLPDKAALQVGVLEKEPQIGMVFGFVQQFLSPDALDQIQNKWACPSAPFPGYIAGAGLFRRECFEKVGLLNEERQIGGFIDWYMRAQEQQIGQKLMDPENVVLRRRIHGNNLGIAFRHNRHDYLQIVKDSLKRRGHCAQ